MGSAVVSAPKRVVVTGLGIVSPIGQTVASFWNACVSGSSGVGPVTLFDASDYPTRIAAEVKDWDPSSFIDKREARRFDRFVQFAAAAARMAFEDSGVKVDEENRNRIGVSIGSGIGGLALIEEQHKILMERGPGRVSPFLIPGAICDMGAGLVSILLGLRGPNTCVVTACATGANSIGDAFEIIKRGAADAMVAGGSEAAITPLGMAGFCAARTMSTRNDDPERASRPFDAERNGFVMGEGSGAIVLESLDFALARGARIYAEIVGYGMSADSHHVTAPAPGGEGASRAMRLALDEAGVAPEEVSYINAHGTSTELNDQNETAAIKTVFGEAAYKVPVSSTKSVMGHMVGAAGAAEAIVSTLAIRDGVIPPTINYENPDPHCDLDYVPNHARHADLDVVLSNSFGFGGHNATLLFRRYRA